MAEHSSLGFESHSALKECVPWWYKAQVWHRQYNNDIVFIRLNVRFRSLPWQHKPKLVNLVGLWKIQSLDFLMNLLIGYNEYVMLIL